MIRSQKNLQLNVSKYKSVNLKSYWTKLETKVVKDTKNFIFNAQPEIQILKGL